MGILWRVLLVVVPLVVAGTNGEVLRVPLVRHEQGVESKTMRTRRVLLEQARVRRRARADLATLEFTETPLGAGIGTHYAELYLGVPTQKASLIVDTGSHWTALPCTSCHGCGTHTDPLFDFAKSTTARYVECSEYNSCDTCDSNKCSIHQGYTEGSMWSAIMIDDVVWVGGLKEDDSDTMIKKYGFHFPLGCQTKETGLFVTQKENGIMGLGQHKETILARMLAAQRIGHNIFSLCFNDDGGAMVLGGMDPTHHLTKIEYTPLVDKHNGFYPVHVKDILLGNTSLGISDAELNSGKGVIVDSGTTDTYFSSSGNDAFQKLFKKLGGMAFSDDSMKISTKQMAKLPDISIVLDGMPGSKDVVLKIPASKYLTPAEGETDEYYGNFHFTERSGGVLGASTMHGLDVVFDVESKRVGFAESHCEATRQDLATNGTATNGTTTAVTTSAPTTEPTRQTSFSSGVQSSFKSTTFILQICAVSVVGVVAVLGWRRMRSHSWSRLNAQDSTRSLGSSNSSGDDGETTEVVVEGGGIERADSMTPLDSPPASGSEDGDATTGNIDNGDNDDDDDPNAPRPRGDSLTPPGSPPPSPPFSPQVQVVVPRFTIGSDSESEAGSPTPTRPESV